MKKIAILLIMLMGITAMCGACSTKYQWSDAINDMNTLKDCGFTVYLENTQEEIDASNELLNSQLKFSQKNFEVTLVNICNLKKADSSICGFKEFASETQAKQMYDYYREISSQQKVVRLGCIIIQTNSDEVISILKYDFQ